MKPKKLNHLLPQLASELQLSEQEVESVLSLYWDRIRKTLSSLEHNRLYMKGLGTFYIKPWAVNRMLKLNNVLIEKYTANPTAHSLTTMNNLFKDNLKLTRAKEVEDQFKIQWEKKRDERHNQDLEGEEQDS